MSLPKHEPVEGSKHERKGSHVTAVFRFMHVPHDHHDFEYATIGQEQRDT